MYPIILFYHIFILLKRSFSIGYAVFRNKKSYLCGVKYDTNIKNSTLI